MLLCQNDCAAKSGQEERVMEITIECRIRSFLESSPAYDFREIALEQLGQVPCCASIWRWCL